MPAHVKIPALSTPLTYVVGGTAQDEFDISFPFFATADIIVLVDGEVLASNAYTVTPSFIQNGDEITGAYGTGTVTLDDEVSNATVIIDRMVDPRRQTDMSATAPMPANTLNSDFDKLTARDQDLKRVLDRTIGFPRGDDDIGFELWPADERAGHFLGFDDDTGSPELLDKSLIGRIYDVAPSVGTVAELLDYEFPSGAVAEGIWVLGYYTVGDCDPMFFRIVDEDTGAHDNFHTIATGEIVELRTRRPELRMFGARANASIAEGVVSGTDGSAALNSAIKYTNATKTALYATGFYRFVAGELANGVCIVDTREYDNITIYGSGPDKTKFYIDDDPDWDSNGDSEPGYSFSALLGEAYSGSGDNASPDDIRLLGSLIVENVGFEGTWEANEGERGVSALRPECRQLVRISGCRFNNIRNKAIRGRACYAYDVCHNEFFNCAKGGCRGLGVFYGRVCDNLFIGTDDDAIDMASLDSPNEDFPSVQRMGIHIDRNILLHGEGFISVGFKHGSMSGNLLFLPHGTAVSIAVGRGHGNSPAFGVRVNDNVILNPIERMEAPDDDDEEDEVLVEDNGSSALGLSTNRASVHTTAVNPQNITGASLSPLTLNVTGHGYTAGQLIYVSGVTGLADGDSQVNRTLFMVDAASTSDAIVLLSRYGDAIDTTDWTAWVSGGTTRLAVAPGEYDPVTKAFLELYTKAGTSPESGSLHVIDTYANNDNDSTVWSNPGGFLGQARGNIIARTLPDTTDYWGGAFGPYFDGRQRTTAPAVAAANFKTNGITVNNDWRGLLIADNQISGFSLGAAVQLRGSKALRALTAMKDLHIRGNFIHDCMYGVIKDSTGGSPTYAEYSSWSVVIDGNTFDIDPYHRAVGRATSSGEPTGAWDSGTYVAESYVGIAMRNAKGWIIRNNLFRNCYQPIYHSAVVGVKIAEGNTVECQPPASGATSPDVFDSAAKGVAIVGSGAIYNHIIRDCDPRSLTFGQVLNTCYSQASVIPGSVTSGNFADDARIWVKGKFVRNTLPAIASGKVLHGWMRLTTGSGNVAGTDWTTLYMSTT